MSSESSLPGSLVPASCRSETADQEDEEGRVQELTAVGQQSAAHRPNRAQRWAWHCSEQLVGGGAQHSAKKAHPEEDTLASRTGEWISQSPNWQSQSGRGLRAPETLACAWGT